MTANTSAPWWDAIESQTAASAVEGLVLVASYVSAGRPPEEVLMMERASAYGASAVFFGIGRDDASPIAQAFVYDGALSDQRFAKVHKKLWSWAGVPLIYRSTRETLQLFRCAHGHDFLDASGNLVCRPAKTLDLAVKISNDAWWDAERLRNGTLWDDPQVCDQLLSSEKSAHKALIGAVKRINDELNDESILPKPLRRKLLILSLLIAYLEQRGVFVPNYFSKFLGGAVRFFEVLGNGVALVSLLEDLEDRFNGNVFSISDEDKAKLSSSQRLARFARLVEGREDANGQLSLWELYSFRDLPVELISHIYQLFVKDVDSSVYTPPALVKLIVDEVLSWDRLDRLMASNEVILDPACGSGVFLVESYKRLVLHWRSKNDWKKPGVIVLKSLLEKIRGIDLEEGAVELAAFSLCLALCDALEPEEIRAQVKLFPPMMGETLHQECFFEAKRRQLIGAAVGVVVGNPPFVSKLTTIGAEESYKRYNKEFGLLPDRQLAYLFLHESMNLLCPGGILGMIQQYNFIYNQKSRSFRQTFISNWDVREILDFVSVRGLFKKGKADTKIVVVVAEATKPVSNRLVLHATFRRSGRAEAGQGFDIDYYDMHWMHRDEVIGRDSLWRSNLLGGGRVNGLIERLGAYPTLGAYADHRGWDYGEGFIEAVPKVTKGSELELAMRKLQPAAHITGKPLLQPHAFTNEGIDRAKLEVATATLFKSPYTERRFSAPMVVVHEQCDLSHGHFEKGYLTYKNQIVGFAAPEADVVEIRSLSEYIRTNKRALQLFVAGTSVKLFTQHATTLSAADIVSLPYPESADLELSVNEQILVDDGVDLMRDLIRLGDKSRALKGVTTTELDCFKTVIERQINGVYGDTPVRALPAQHWPGIVCQPFVFGNGEVDWEGIDELKGKLNTLLNNQQRSLRVTRICRLYTERFLFLLKPDRHRYWLRSVALRDADEVLADMRTQGY